MISHVCVWGYVPASNGGVIAALLPHPRHVIHPAQPLRTQMEWKQNISLWTIIWWHESFSPPNAKLSEREIAFYLAGMIKCAHISCRSGVNELRYGYVCSGMGGSQLFCRCDILVFVNLRRTSVWVHQCAINNAHSCVYILDGMMIRVHYSSIFNSENSQYSRSCNIRRVSRITEAYKRIIWLLFLV